MEDKCFQEGCEQEAFLLCKCTDPPIGVCELHFPEHLRKNRFGIHDLLVLKIQVNPSDSQEVIEVLESHKRNIYSNMQKLAHVTKQLHLSIEAEFAKELNELRKREMEIQKLIEELSDLTEFRTDRENPILFDLFSNESARKAERLNRYKELSRVFDLSSLKKSCDEFFSRNAHLNYSADELCQFSTDSSTFITYDFLTMQKTEKFLEGDLLDSKVMCILPDRRLFCFWERNKWFLFDIRSNTVTFLDDLRSGRSQIVLLDDDTIHLLFEEGSYGTVSRNVVSHRYYQFNLRKMKWANSGSPDFNAEKEIKVHDVQLTCLVKFQGIIYAVGGDYVYMYSRENQRFIKIIRSYYYFGLLFEGRNKLFLLYQGNQYGKNQNQNPTLFYIEPSSKKLVELKQYSHQFQIPNYTMKSGNSLYLCSHYRPPMKFDPETYEITEFPEVKT